MRSSATQNQAADEDYLEPETNSKMTKGSTEEEGPASVDTAHYAYISGADAIQDVSHVGRRRQSARGSSRVPIAHASVSKNDLLCVAVLSDASQV